MKEQNLSSVKKIHFVGIKGVAMTALALLSKESGYIVSGSDTEEVFPTDATLTRAGITPLVGFDAAKLPQDCDLIIYTGAHGGVTNSQVIEGQRRGITTLPHGKALALFTKSQQLIAVGGSHGKTTTSSLIAHILMTIGDDPSFAVGCGEIVSLKTSGHFGHGEYMVVEADEYVMDPLSDRTPRFLSLNPKYLLITNIDFDHPDVYDSLENVQNAFVDFTKRLEGDGAVVLNIDDPKSVEIASKIPGRVVTFGSTPTADFQLQKIVVHDQKQTIIVRHDSRNTTIELHIPGKHNAYNALGAFALLVSAGFLPEKIQKAFTSFKSTKRRFEMIAQKNNKILIDDYAHHPTEIAATIEAARSWYPKRRLICIFQPHTYSRTKSLLSEFARVLSLADLTILCDIYASAREVPMKDFSGEHLFKSIKAYSDNVVYAPQEANVLQYIEASSKPGDVIITMGAGSIYSWLSDLERVL